MKKYKYFLALPILLFLFASCEKETEGVSRVTNYATFQMSGDPFMFILLNAAYTEPGVKAFEGETELTVETKSTVNTAAAGVYTVKYSAKNSDGFSASVLRTIAVVAAMPSVNISGIYDLVHATRVKDIEITVNDGILGYYHASDSWWQSLKIPLDFVDMGDGTITVLEGSSPYGGHYGTGSILFDENQITFTVTLVNQGPMVYTTTFQKRTE
jgi:hypothetical protein